MPGALLVTGVTGFLGGQVVARYLERTDREIVVLVRAADDAEAAGRAEEALAATYGSDHAYSGRVSAVAADMEKPGFGLDESRLDELAERVTSIVHAAASVEFSLPLEDARRVNVGGTQNILDFAKRCQERGGLDRLSHVSTTYVAGAHDGHFEEDDLDIGQELRNTYERTKLEAEKLLHREAGSLPLRIFRPGIVVGEQHSGWTASFNVLYFPLKIFARGTAPPVIPARRDTPIDCVPIDYVADAIYELTERDGDIGTTFHLVSGARAATAGDILDACAKHFGKRPPRLMPLGLYMHTLHHVVVRAYRGKRRRRIKQAGVYLPYFSMRQTFGDERTRALLEPAGITAPPLMDYFEALLSYAIKSEWGRAALSRNEAREQAA